MDIKILYDADKFGAFAEMVNKPTFCPTANWFIKHHTIVSITTGSFPKKDLIFF